MKIVRLNADVIVDRPLFHEAFKSLFGFPDCYGANMDAWIECMSELDDEDEITGFKLDPGEMLQIEIAGVESFAKRLPEVFEDLVSCTAFVNRNYLERTGKAVVCMVFL